MMDLLPNEIQLHIYNYLDRLHQYNFAICSKSTVYLVKRLTLENIVQYGNVKQVKQYVKESNKELALRYSAKYGKLKTLIYLIEEQGVTPKPTTINIAAEAGYLKVVEYLIKFVTPNEYAVRSAIKGSGKYTS